MYKTKLQELCHQRSWNLPEYTTVKNGPDHNLRFTATALVNGLPFETPDECHSSKEAQNQAAKLACEHFTLPTPIPQQPTHSPNLTAPPPPPSGVSTPNTFINIGPADIGILLPTNQKNVKTSRANEFPSSFEDNKKSKELLHLYKNQLQNYAQKRNLTLPVYTNIVEGPPHARRFKSRVTVNGKTYETSDCFSTLKEAEHSAAQVAFESLPHDEVQENEGLYKTLLQELAQKKGFKFPAYNTARSGTPHMTTFASSVEVGGRVFKGEEAKTKKLAEMNAAKAAYNDLTERRSSPDPTDWVPGGHSKEDLGVTSSILQSIIDDGPRPVMVQDANDVIHEEQEDKGVSTPNTFINIGPADIGILLPTNQKNVKTSRANEFPSSFEDNKKSKELLHLYKNQLQNYAQKRNLTLPVYTNIVEGPPHARRFKSRVTVNGKTYETSDRFSTLKEAEHSAAQVAFESLAHDEVQENEGLYKTLLQELAQKKGFKFPAYNTARSGPPHLPTFASSVEVGGRVFKGEEAKTKKQAEMNAAKAAYNDLTERRSSPDPTDLVPGGHSKEDLGVTSSILQSIIDDGPQPVMVQDANDVIHEEQEDKGKANLSTTVLSYVGYGEMLKKSLFGMDSVLTDDSQRKLISKSERIICEEQDAEVKDAQVKRQRSSSSSDNIYVQLRDPFPPIPSPDDGASTPTTEESTSSISESEAEAGLNAIPFEKVTVYPYRADMTFPDGSTLLPFSDDKWVAIKANHNP